MNIVSRSRFNLSIKMKYFDTNLFQRTILDYFGLQQINKYKYIKI